MALYDKEWNKIGRKYLTSKQKEAKYERRKSDEERKKKKKDAEEGERVFLSPAMTVRSGHGYT